MVKYLGMISIRKEQPQDITAVRNVNLLAFGRPDEANLVDALRANCKALLSLVAEMEEQVVGHILFSPVTIDCGLVQYQAVGLAPLAVYPVFQRQNIGSRLVLVGLEQISNQGHTAVIVLGSSDYYTRFGFIPSKRYGIRWEKDAPENDFMAIELCPGALAGRSGVIRYSPEFNSI